MRFLLIAFATLLLAVVLGDAALRHPGIVVVGVGDYMIQMSFVLFALLLLTCVVVLYVLLHVLARIWALPGGVSRWSAARRQRKGLSALSDGLMALAEGNWRDAERTLVRGAERAERPLLHYLGAAAAAQRQCALERRDQYLRLAQERAPRSVLAVGLTRAELQLQQAQLEAARTTLAQLREIDPAHPHVIRLLEQLYLRTGDFESARHLLPELKRRKVLPSQEMTELQYEVHRGLLSTVAKVPGVVEGAWKQLPRSARKDPRLIALHAQNLSAIDEGQRAERLLRAALKKQWNAELVRLYGRLDGVDTKAQLRHLEEWLEQRGDDPDLLFALGDLCLRSRLWGPARGHLEAALARAPRAHEYQLLAEVLEHMGEADAAAEATRKGLQLATGALVPTTAPVSSLR